MNQRVSSKMLINRKLNLKKKKNAQRKRIIDAVNYRERYTLSRMQETHT